MNNIRITISSKRHGAIKKNKKIQKENLEKFLKEAGIDIDSLTLMKQVHGNMVTLVDNHQAIIDAVDGVVTSKKIFFLGVLTADCVPVLLFDKDQQIISAVHAGYKGILMGIVENAIEKMVRFGAKLNDINVILGPSIGSCCYSINTERAQLFRKQFGLDMIEERNGKTFLNLAGVVKKILLNKQISEKHIFNSDICTSCHNNDYFSFRREGDSFGTFVSIIGME